MASRRFLWITIPLYLGLIWFTSSISATKGLYLFMVGLGALVLAVVKFRRGRRRLLYSLYFTVFLLSLIIGAVEGLIRLAPGMLRGKAAIYTYSGYHADPGGIYANDRHLGYRMKPGASRRIYWLGHWWQHETNEDGYRGPAVDRADAIFLGDSLIYGHGVENADTVPTRFANQTGMKVANLGQQGTSLVQMWLRLRELGPKLKPKTVFVCAHPNDILDGSYWYPLDEMKRFVASGLEEDYLPVARKKYWPASGFSPAEGWNDHVAMPLRTARLFRYLLRVLKKGGEESSSPTAAISTEQFLPTASEREAPFAPWIEGTVEREKLGWQVHVHALKKIKHYCDQHGAKLVLFDLGYSYDFCQAMKDVAEEMNVEYVPAGQMVLTQALEGQDLYLKNDGHWNGEAAEIIARELAKTLRK